MTATRIRVRGMEPAFIPAREESKISIKTMPLAPSRAAPGKKALSFLQYLIVNHRRNISAQELIHQFWEESGDPANALKHMMFKIGICTEAIPK